MKPGQFTLAYCTNIWSHHQAPVCSAFAELLGPERFRMCLFEPVQADRVAMGWAEHAATERWVAGPPAASDQLTELTRLVCDADVAVLGDTPLAVQQARVATGKLTFVSSERIWKKPYGLHRFASHRIIRFVFRYRNLTRRPHVHYLPMGAYAAEDVRKIGAYGPGRFWQWGYFTQIPAELPPMASHSGVRLLWVGRMLQWKRVDLLIDAVDRIRKEPGFGGLTLVGLGPEKPAIQEHVRRLGLEAQVRICGPVKPDAIRALMHEHDIYVLASNRWEGWGAVANEAMAEGCVLVSNDQAGAGPVLIRDGVTGFLFRDGDAGDLARILAQLVRDPFLRERIRAEAWRHMNQFWHPRVAAASLVSLCEGLLGLAPIPEVAYGPCRRC